MYFSSNYFAQIYKLQGSYKYLWKTEDVEFMENMTSELRILKRRSWDEIVQNSVCKYQERSINLQNRLDIQLLNLHLTSVFNISYNVYHQYVLLIEGLIVVVNII